MMDGLWIRFFMYTPIYQLAVNITALLSSGGHLTHFIWYEFSNHWMPMPDYNVKKYHQPMVFCHILLLICVISIMHKSSHCTYTYTFTHLNIYHT